jgi:spermidine synthase
MNNVIGVQSVKTKWFKEAGFILIALITGLNVQFTWFASMWANRGTLLEFAQNGSWERHSMPFRLAVSALAMVIIFYFIRFLVRLIISQFLTRQSEMSDYKKRDVYPYFIFLITCAGYFGIYFDFFQATIFFALLQFLLVFWVISKNKIPEPDSPKFNADKFYVLFFISGFAAIIYQVVWQRALFQFYGVNIESVTIIVSIFMFGLGIGSLVGGYLSKVFSKYLLQLFVICELSVGIFGVFSLYIINYFSELTITGSTLTKSLVTYGMLAIPTIFMGSTLPILVSYFYNNIKNVGKTVSLLYFINTLGSAFASFFTVGVLFVYLGMFSTTLFAALCNFTVAVLGYMFISRGKTAISAGSKETVNIEIKKADEYINKKRYFLILILSGICGFIAMSQEILWIRLVSYSTGAQATVFAFVLGFILLGIAFGSYKASAYCEKYKDNIFQIIILLLLASSTLYFLLIPLISNSFAIIDQAAFFFMYLSLSVVSYLTGAIFPLLSHYAINTSKNVGFSVSGIYFSNIVGSTSGPIFTGFFLLQWFTFEKNVLFFSVFSFLIGLILWMITLKDNPFKKKFAIGLIILAIISFSSFGFLYNNIFEKIYFKTKYESGEEFRHTIQNRNGIINTVSVPEGDDIILGDGMYDGRFNISLLNNRNGIDRAYMMAALKLNPRKALEIGMSGASWSRVMANYSGLDSIDIVEINPGYLDIIDFYPENRTIKEDNRIKIYIDDGRRWLRTNNNKYDFILMNTTFHWRSEVNNLLSVEFLEICKKHLNEGGVLYYNATGSKDVEYTAAKVFKYVTTYSSFVAGSDEPFTSDTTLKKMSLRKFIKDGEPVFKPDNKEMEEILDKLALSNIASKSDAIENDSEGLYILTDDNLASEYKTGKLFYFKPRSWYPLLSMIF